MADDKRTSFFSKFRKYMTEQEFIPQEEELTNPEAAAPSEETTEENTVAKQDDTEALKAELAEMRDRYHRLYAEFDNFRRRTQREKAEMQLTASKEVMKALLPALDDLERSLKASENSNLPEMRLPDSFKWVISKMQNILQSQGLQAMDTAGIAFDPELHEAVTDFPSSEENKGMVLETLEKGYYLNGTIIRFAKVVVGA